MLNIDQHKLTIALPRPTQYTYRGFTNKQAVTLDTTPIGVRWTKEDHKFVEQQAIKLGITFSEFVRWCAYYCAVEANKLMYIEQFKSVSDNILDDPPQPQEPDYSDYE